MAHRKLQQEVDRVFKKINEGTEVFDQIHERHEQAENPQLREKLEGELKREVKKLQKLREQVKVWQASSEVKDKDSLAVYRRKVEVAMEEYKAVERGSKVKAYSNMSLRNGGELDPEEKEKMETIQFIQETIDELERQFQVSEVELEKLQSKKGKRANAANSSEKEELKEIQGKYRWHQQQLELALRLLENGELDHSQITDIKEDIEYFLQNNREPDFAEDEFIYDSLDLEANAVVQKEIAEGFASVDENIAVNNNNNHNNNNNQVQPTTASTVSSPSPAKQTRESTPVPSQPSQPAPQVSTPKSKKFVTLGSASPSSVSTTLRPAAAPADPVKWSALAAGVDSAKEQKEKEEKERLEKERLEKERKEQEEKERLEREEEERKEREEHERVLREEREKREREEREERERERQRRVKEREDREREKRAREEREREREIERERERERKRERRLQSYGVASKPDEPHQIIITGSSPALLKHLEEQKRIEEEKLLKEQLEQVQEESEENAPLAPLDETIFRNDSELLLLPPGLQDIVCSYYASRRTNDKMVSSVADAVRPPREYLPTTAVPSLSACVELNRAQNLWSVVRAQLASAEVSPNIPSAGLAADVSSHATPKNSPSPSFAAAVSNTISNILAKLDSGTLFYAFYYALTPFETNAAEQELVKRQWRADLGKKCWYQRIVGAPVKQGRGFEVASYKKFDAESWALQELLNYKLDYDALSA